MAFLVTLLIQIAVALVMLVVSYLLTPKPKQDKNVAARDLNSPTADAGREMSVLFGTMMTKSPNCLWFGEKSKRTYKVNA